VVGYFVVGEHEVDAGAVVVVVVVVVDVVVVVVVVAVVVVGQDMTLQDSVSVASPWHSRPPKAGGMQCRPRVLFPSPQVSLQVLHSPQSPHFPSIGHGLVWHATVWLASPWQAPGASWSEHWRSLSETPQPQVVEQADQSVQGDQVAGASVGWTVLWASVVGSVVGGTGGSAQYAGRSPSLKQKV